MQILPKNVKPDDVMLIDIIYNYPKKNTDYKDYLNIVYKTISTGEKHIHTIETPPIDIYFTKEEFRNYDYNKVGMPLTQLDKHSCKYKDVLFYIANQAGGDHLKFYHNCNETGQRAKQKNLHKYPYVFGSDFPIDSLYRHEWSKQYPTDKRKHLTKQYLDIEVDGIYIAGVPNDGTCPINAVTILDEESKVCHTFLLDTTEDIKAYINKYAHLPDDQIKHIHGLKALRENFNENAIKDFVKNIDNFTDTLHENFDEFYGRLDYKIYMYEDEREMLTDLFKLINTLKRDFLLIWNMPFDIPYIIDRMTILGMDYTEIICHPDFKIKECYFKKDKFNFVIAEKTDSFAVSSYTVFLCQMKQYAAIRKGKSELRSNKLNMIAKDELGDEKLDYSETADIKTLPYVDYAMFVLYNIKDVLLQYGIERRAHDVENLYSRSESNFVSYEKNYKPTVFLKTRAYTDYLSQGYVMGNNANIEFQLLD